MINRTRLLAIARKEVIQLRRDTRSLMLAFLLPVLLLILFGYAISWDVNHIPMAVVDQDRSPQSRELQDTFRASGYFEITARPERAADAEHLLATQDVWVVVVIPPGFANDLGAGRTATLQALFDGSDANSATIALGYARALVQSYATRVVLQTTRVTPPVDIRSRVWYNEELTSRNMIVPGLVAVIMMIIAAMLTALTIAREWERGTMEQLIATPVHRVEVVIGKILPYVGIALFDVIVVTVVGVVVFGVPFRGSIVLLMGLTLAFLIGALGLGVFISAAAKSQLLATQIAMLATFLPAFLLSGFMFDVAIMPPVLRAISYLIPARYFLVVTRGIFLKGVGVEALAVQGLLMIVFAACGIMAAVRAFRKEIQ